jgi:chromate transport protein ChrA
VQQIAAVPFYITLAIAMILPQLARIGTCACCRPVADDDEELTAKPSEPVSATTPAVSPLVASSATATPASPATAATAKSDDDKANKASKEPLRWNSRILHDRYTLLGLILVGLLMAMATAGYAVYCAYEGLPNSPAFGFGKTATKNLNGAIFLVGLAGGLLTFGGAYTAVPFIREEAVVIAHWLTGPAFLDALALGNVVPAPLVMFVTFVGYYANNVPGAVLMTLGMFIPAFSFTMIGHEFLEMIVDSPTIHASLDGLTASVAGLIAVTAVTFLKRTVTNHLQAVVFIVALYVMFT